MTPAFGNSRKAEAGEPQNLAFMFLSELSLFRCIQNISHIIHILPLGFQTGKTSSRMWRPIAGFRAVFSTKSTLTPKRSLR